MRRRNPDFNTKNVVTIVGIGVAAYFVYTFFNKGKKLLQDATLPISAAIAAVWNKLTLTAPLQVLGDVVLPDGTDVGPLSKMQVRMDAAGNVYTLITGDLYQLGQSDSNGNWPAQLVLDPNFGVTGGNAF